jgi:hypothetical protein
MHRHYSEGTIMFKIFYLGAVGLAAFLDLAAGTAFATILGVLSHTELEWWHLVSGALFFVLPDFDLILPILRRVFFGERIAFNHHETVFHWPIFMIPVVTIVAWAVGGSFWGLLAFFGLVFHYLHDASNMVPADRLRWFFRPFPQFWSLEKRPDPGYVESDEWIKTRWMQPSAIALRELMIGSICIGITVYLLTFLIVPSLGTMVMVDILIIIYWLSSDAFLSE